MSIVDRASEPASFCRLSRGSVAWQPKVRETPRTTANQRNINGSVA
jgi:hypothetical protein